MLFSWLELDDVVGCQTSWSRSAVSVSMRPDGMAAYGRTASTISWVTNTVGSADRYLLGFVSVGVVAWCVDECEISASGRVPADDDGEIGSLPRWDVPVWFKLVVAHGLLSGWRYGWPVPGGLPPASGRWCWPVGLSTDRCGSVGSRTRAGAGAVVSIGWRDAVAGRGGMSVRPVGGWRARPRFGRRAGSGRRAGRRGAAGWRTSLRFGPTPGGTKTNCREHRFGNAFRFAGCRRR
jgi:hypothetical protein